MLRAGSDRAGCSGLCPFKFQLLEKMEAPEHLWADCSGVCPYWRNVVLQSDRISCVLVFLTVILSLSTEEKTLAPSSILLQQGINTDG